MSSLEIAWNFQRKLSSYQAFPVLGPVIISPIKATVSVAQAILGFAAAVILGTFSGVLLFNPYLGKKFLVSLAHFGQGSLGCGYSLANMLTLGGLAYAIERREQSALAD
jgi:hypothetical protein